MNSLDMLPLPETDIAAMGLDELLARRSVVTRRLDEVSSEITEIARRAARSSREEAARTKKSRKQPRNGTKSTPGKDDAVALPAEVQAPQLSAEEQDAESQPRRRVRKRLSALSRDDGLPTRKALGSWRRKKAEDEGGPPKWRGRPERVRFRKRGS